MIPDYQDLLDDLLFLYEIADDSTHAVFVCGLIHGVRNSTLDSMAIYEMMSQDDLFTWTFELKKMWDGIHDTHGAVQFVNRRYEDGAEKSTHI